MKRGLTLLSGGAASGNRAVLLTLKAGPVSGTQDETEKVREEIQLRATAMSRVLDKILHEPHGVSRWGLNE
jgi:hypothetical protein